MMKRIILVSSFVVLVFTIISCKDHECPVPEIILSGSTMPDAQVNSYAPNYLAGTGEKLGATAWTYSGTYGAVRGFINFDLSSVPANSEIVSAYITFHADTTNMPYGHSQLTGSNTWKLKRITSSWDELTLTWNTKPTYDNVNAISMPASTSASETYTADITTFIKDQYAHPTLYYGIMMQLDNESVYRAIVFCSKEHRYAATLAPNLVIKYRMKS